MCRGISLLIRLTNAFAPSTSLPRCLYVCNALSPLSRFVLTIHQRVPNSPLTKDQLEVLRQQVLSEGDLVSVQSRFNYAWGLIKSDVVHDQRLGVKILTDVYKDSPQRRRECLYYLAIGTFKLGDYADARRYVESLIAHEPENHQALALQQMINDKIAKDGLIGIALVSGLVAAGATALSLFLRNSKRR